MPRPKQGHSNNAHRSVVISREKRAFGISCKSYEIHNERIQEEFSKQAPRFGEKGLTLSSQDILDWIVDFLPS